jgi:uncharacterized lipoprotein YddW (UPF0748 family)
MEKKQAVLIVLLFLVFSCVCLPAQSVNTKTGAVWMTGSTLTSQNIDSVASSLANNYVREVYILGKNSNGVFIDSTLLANFIKKAHFNGIKVDIWYVVGQDNAYVTANPDAHVYHCPNPTGSYTSPYKNTAAYVNFLYPGYKDYVLANIDRFLTNFNCDGIHLDWMRYSHVVYSWDTISIHKADSLGVNTSRLLNLIYNNYTSLITNQGIAYTSYANGDTDVVKWTNMRKSIISDYITSIKALIQKDKPGAELSVLFMPEGTYDLKLADTYYAQNYAEQTPLVDVVVPEAYFKEFGQGTSWVQTVTQNAISLSSPNCKVITGIQTYDGATAAQAGSEITYALSGGAQGTVAYTAEATTADQWNVINPLYKAMDSTSITNSQLITMCGSIYSLFPSGSTGTVPDSIYTDTTKTTLVSAADFYYMMAYWYRYYGVNNNTPPLTIPILRNIAGPLKPGGGEPTSTTILKADLIAQGKVNADYIEANKAIPDSTTINNIGYDAPEMFSAFSRSITYYKNNGAMPNYASVRLTKAPNTWTYGDSVVIPVPVIIPVVSIADARKQTVNNLIPDKLGDTVQVYGVVTSPNLSDTAASYFIQDTTAGIQVHYDSSWISKFNVGDSVKVIGTISQYYGLTRLVPLAKDTADFYCVKHNAAVPAAKMLTLNQYLPNAENYEGQRIEIDTLHKIAGAWKADTTILVRDVSNSDSVSIYINANTNIASMKEPAYPINITAIASQRTSGSAIVSGGYVLVPVDTSGIKTITLSQASVTETQLKNICSSIYSSFPSGSMGTVPDSIYTDSTKTTLVSAADFYYMMAYWFRYYGDNNVTPSTIPIIRNVLGPLHPGGSEPTSTTIPKADLLAQAKINADYIEAHKVLPDSSTVDTVSYDAPEMFSAFSRSITWFYNNGNTMPNYASVRLTTGPKTWTCGDITDAVTGKKVVPLSFSLKQNYPNPFNPTTMIEFDLPKSSMVTLKVYDILGREVSTLINRQMTTGSYKISFNASYLPSGIYFYRINTENNVSVKKMILLK